MKICWDNLEKLEYRPDRNEWKDKRYTQVFYVYKDSCKNCGEPFLVRKNKPGEFCDNFCGNHGEHNSMYGKKRPEMCGENHPMWGKKHSPEIRKKMKENQPDRAGIKNSFYGKQHTLKTKKQMRENHADISGKNNSNWKGGISCEPYCDVWIDKDFKESIKERDGYQCLNPMCLKNSKTLCIHHINYIKKDCNPKNLITLCNSCNSKANYNREWHKEQYNNINRIGMKNETITLL